MKDNKLKLLIHIGQSKTGSTAIQTFLNQNQKSLIENHNILYPNMMADEFAKQMVLNHKLFFEHIAKQSDDAFLLNKISDCVAYCKINHISKIIISLEGLFTDHWAPELTNRIIKLFNCDFMLILYLRRQDHWIESAWKQWGHKDKSIENLSAYISEMNLDWSKNLHFWLQYFKPEDFIVRSFEKESIREDVVIDFIQLLGIDDLSLLQRQDEIKIVNIGFKPEIIELLNLCKGLTSDEHDNSFFELFDKALSDKYKKTSAFDPYGLLSPKERYEIVKKYDASNNEIARLFFGTERKSLFEEPWPDPDEPWETEQGLTLEKVIPIFMEIFLYLHKQHKSWTFREDFFNCFKFIKIELTKIYKNTRITNQIKGFDITYTGLEFVSEGSDPYIFIHKTILPKRMKVIRIEITVPGNTTIQVFYKTRILQNFNESNSVQKPLKEGRNIVTVFLSFHGVSGSLRIDPGTSSGKYVIHNMMIGS